MNVVFAKPDSLRVVPWKSMSYRNREKMCQNTNVHIAVLSFLKKVIWMSVKENTDNKM